MEKKMIRIKEASNASYGRVKIAITENHEVLFCMQDVCKLFSINLQNTRTRLDTSQIFSIKLSEHKNDKKLFISDTNLKRCLTFSTEEKADGIYKWLTEVKFLEQLHYGTYSLDDLEDRKIAQVVLKRLQELEIICSVQKVKLEEDAFKVKLVDSLYGAKSPVDFNLVPALIKYKGISIASILEDLRLNGIFNEDNIPYQKYLDEGYFRLVSIISHVKAEEIKLTKVLIYQKGIRLIEGLLKKKAGLKNERKPSS